MSQNIEKILEKVIFSSRWLMAPMYLGMIVALGVLLIKFTITAVSLAVEAPSGADGIILGILGLLDISLTANLVFIVMLAGWENFVSRLDITSHPDRPAWFGHIGFGEIKLKLMTSIIAISAVHVLEDFMNAANMSNRELAWRAGLHLLFIFSGVCLAIMDRLARMPGSKEYE